MLIPAISEEDRLYLGALERLAMNHPGLVTWRDLLPYAALQFGNASRIDPFDLNDFLGIFSTAYPALARPMVDAIGQHLSRSDAGIARSAESRTVPMPRPALPPAIDFPRPNIFRFGFRKNV